MCQHSISPFGRIPLVKISDVKNGNRFELKPSNIQVDTPKSHCIIVKRSSVIVANAATQVKSLFISNITCGITVVKSLLFAQQRAPSKGTYTPIPERSLLDVYAVHLHVHNSKTSIYTCRHIPERRRSHVMNATILPLKQVT